MNSVNQLIIMAMAACSLNLFAQTCEAYENRAQKKIDEIVVARDAEDYDDGYKLAVSAVEYMAKIPTRCVNAEWSTKNWLVAGWVVILGAKTNRCTASKKMLAAMDHEYAPYTASVDRKTKEYFDGIYSIAKSTYANNCS
jgi:hypothetical protein